jgi:hypothetical protein
MLPSLPLLRSHPHQSRTPRLELERVKLLYAQRHLEGSAAFITIAPDNGRKDFNRFDANKEILSRARQGVASQLHPRFGDVGDVRGSGRQQGFQDSIESNRASAVGPSTPALPTSERGL